MNVLSIGTDRKLFEQGSAVQERNKSYASRMESLHIIVFTLRRSKYKNINIAPNIFIYPTNSFSRWLYVFDALRIGKKIIENIKNEKNEKNDKNIGSFVVTAQDPFECGFVAYRLVRSSPESKLHIQIHTDFLSPYFKDSFLQHLRIFIAWQVLPKAHAVRVVSKKIADSLIQKNLVSPERINILPIRVDVARIENTNTNTNTNLNLNVNLKNFFPQYNFIIFMASRLSPEKRIEDALLVCSILSKKYPKLGLVIAGSGSEKDHLKSRAKSLGLYKNVIFLGARNDVPQLLASAGVFLSTSEYEGYGMSLVEAVLSRCPVVSTSTGVSSQVNVRTCPVGYIDCLVKNIEWVINNPAESRVSAERLASDMKATIPSEEEYVDQYIDSLRRALKNT